MEEYRKIINDLDNKIMDLLVNRLLVVKDIGEYKKKNKIPVFDVKREQLIFDKIDEKYKNIDSNQFLKNIYAKMMVETKKIQY
jgi:monofunctional chorismate mutase